MSEGAPSSPIARSAVATFSGAGEVFAVLGVALGWCVREGRFRFDDLDGLVIPVSGVTGFAFAGEVGASFAHERGLVLYFGFE
jgi:hypothetical protein